MASAGVMGGVLMEVAKVGGLDESRSREERTIGGPVRLEEGRIMILRVNGDLRGYN
jgi:hypothetical protein